jgi:hypothetical protein
LRTKGHSSGEAKRKDYAVAFSKLVHPTLKSSSYAMILAKGAILLAAPLAKSLALGFFGGILGVGRKESFT